MKVKLKLFFIALVLNSCIGVDVLEDPLGFLKILNGSFALSPEQEIQLEASYRVADRQVEVPLVWSSLNVSIATVSSSGLVRALSPGQAKIVVAYLLASDTVTVNVVADENAVATVTVSTEKDNLMVGESTPLQVLVKNIGGELLPDIAVEWFSENSSLASVSQEGMVTALQQGVVGIHAKADGVKSNVIDFTIGAVRTGNFVPTGGYTAKGMATLKVENNQLLLTLSDDFNTSFVDTYIYLANSTSGSVAFNTGIEVQRITTGGAKTFNISAMNPDIQLFDFRYIIILCRGARLTFGYADLNE